LWVLQYLIYLISSALLFIICRHSLKEVLDAPNVMSLIKDTKAAQEVPSKSKQCTFFTFPFGPAPPAEYAE